MAERNDVGAHVTCAATTASDTNVWTAAPSRYRRLSLNWLKTMPNVAIYMSLYDILKMQFSGTTER
eukprot:2296755-Pleurochrysis_carterae.AAC.1